MTKAMDLDIWSQKEMTDRQFMLDLIPHAEELFGKVRLKFSDGDVIVSKRMAFLNLFWFPIVNKFGIPLRKSHFVKRKPINQDVLVKEWNRYYEEVLGQNPQNAKKLKQVIWGVLQDLNKFCSEDLLPYTGTIDMLDMVEIMSDPPIAKIIATKEKITPEMGTDVIEKIVDSNSKKIMEILGTSGALKNEALRPYQATRQINKFQVPQTIYAFGVRTDVSDNIVGLPVIGSALEGLRNIQEYAVEHLSAKKSQFYNKVAVADSQYFGRKQHLIASSVQFIYSHDCMSTALIKFRVTPQNYQNLVGKLAFKDGKAFTISYDNCGSLVGDEIAMRSPMTCRYRKGVCTVCGGRIFNNINRKINVGILSAIHVIEPTTQKILSAKHLVKTLSLMYEMLSPTDGIMFRSSNNEIRWKPSFVDKVKKLWMGIPLKYFTAVHDVTLLRSDKPVKEERFSKVENFTLWERGTDKKVLYPLRNQQQVPFFSMEMLFHIRDHYNELEMDEEMMWIPLAGTEKHPVFRTIIVNDNMLAFVNQVSGFLQDNICNHTTCSGALQEFSDIVHSKVSANIVHLETLLKSYLITSKTDYRIPLVTDPDNVMFQTTGRVLDNRHVGTKLAFEKLKSYMCSPSTYLLPHQPSPFDLFTIGR